jgi:hypothetical protein
MNIHELIAKHSVKAFDNNKCYHECLSDFAIELLEMVKPPMLSLKDKAEPEWKQGYEHAASRIDKALKELKK